MSSTVQVYYEATPNPHSMKFIVDRPIAAETLHFTSFADSARSPLAAKLFGFPWAAAVLIGPHFVTVTKQDWVDWPVLADPLSRLIQEHLERGEGVLLPAPEIPPEKDETAEPIVFQIKEVLDREIRPAVAQDGGDVSFHSFANNTVYLRMQGACSGCPSAAMTLKLGIESRLKELFPEVHEVVAV